MKSNSTFLRRTTNDLKVEDHVDVIATEKESIPPKANPFHYDSFHMGDVLSRDWMVMHQGGSITNKPLEYIILINTATGQRIQLDFFPKETVEKDLIYYSACRDQRIGAGPFYLPFPSESISDGIEWKELTDNRGLNDNVYVCFGDFFAKYSLVKNKEEFLKAVEEEFFEIKVSDSHYNEKLSNIADWKMKKAIEDIRAVEEENRNK